jgi:hypothetical protein
LVVVTGETLQVFLVRITSGDVKLGERRDGGRDDDVEGDGGETSS